MIAFSVAAKAARFAGSFNTSSATRAWSAEIAGVDGGLTGFCANDGVGTPRRTAHRMTRTKRIIGGLRPQMPPPGQRNFGHEAVRWPVSAVIVARTTLHKSMPGPIVRAMHGFLAVLIGILMLATLGVLIAGMVGLVREGDPRRSNKLMQWRVLLQGAAILLFVILMSLLRS